MELSNNSKKVQDFLDSHDLSLEVKELPQSTRTSEDAAKSIGCGVEQIAKSIIFRGEESGNPYLVIASGKNRIDEKILEKGTGERLEKADAKFVKESTGFSIGGIPPFGHIKKIKTFIDKELFEHEFIWAAAGMPNSVFRLNPEQLKQLSEGEVLEIAYSKNL